MKNKLVIPVLLLALIGVFGWGYSQYQTKHQWEINAENQYQRAFEELTAHATNLETAMSKALVAGSFPQSIQMLTSAWREANSCQNELGQLPLTSMDLSHTKMLLASISTFCFNAAQNKMLKGTTINEIEWKTLRSLRDRTKLVKTHLSNLRLQFYNNRARWLQVDRLGMLGATGVASSFNNNKVTKSFLMLEDGLRRVPDLQFEGNNLDFVPKPTGLTGKNVSARDAVEIAKRFLAAEFNPATVKYERLIKGGFPSYMILARNPRNPDEDRRLSISVKGGHLVWMLGNRTVRKNRLTPEQIENKAIAFLNRHGYKGMERVAREEFENVTTLTMVPFYNGILHYPELIKIQVAQDNGEILGLDAVSYLTFANPNENRKAYPRFTEARIRRLFNPHFKPERIRLAQVLDEMYNKVLCYEVFGREGPNRYLLYYNANTGKEEKIRRIDRDGNEVG